MIRNAESRLKAGNHEPGTRNQEPETIIVILPLKKPV
jgi:hypothetical protein